MRSTYFFGLFAALGTVAACVAGCGGDDGGNGGAGGAGTTTSTTTTSTTTTGTPATSTTSTGGMADGNDSFETAASIEIDATAVQGTLEPVDTDSDYYKFSGTKGQALLFITDAKPDTDETDPKYPDLVITLFDAAKNQIARNDDPPGGGANDSQLLTVLPDDGDYYIVVEECNKALGPDSCADAGNIEIFDYAIAIATLDPADESVVADTEPDDTAANAVPLEYASNGDMGYYTTILLGNFASAADVDVYKFQVPAEPAVTNSLKANFFFNSPTGINGNGSTVDVSEISIYTPDDLTHAYATVDPSKGGDIGVAVDPNVEYLLFVKRAAGATGANDFYIVTHGRSDSDEVEAEEVTNGVPLTPEALTSFMNRGGGESFAVDGELPDGATADADIYALPLPAAVAPDWTVTAICGAQRHGSGVRGLKVEFLNGDGTALTPAADYTATETEDADLLVDGKPLPANVQQNRLLAKVTAGTGATDVKSRGYNCLFAYVPPQN